MVNIGIVGVSGYSGCETLKILLKHSKANIAYISANNTTGELSKLWPELKGQTDLMCEKFDCDQAIKAADVFFLAVPHTSSMAITPKLLEASKKVIDLSGDYRLDSAQVYEQWYKAKHTDRDRLTKAVYGLPELYREDIKKANLIANPGCYPTAAILGLMPICATQTDAIESIIIDAKSGVSGAGRNFHLDFIAKKLQQNFKAYKVLKHQHTPEIELYLSKVASKPIKVHFAAHLLPVDRGILETIYVSLNTEMNLEDIHKIYTRFYKTEKFVRVLPAEQQPELKDVVHTNYCDIGLTLSEDKKMLVITSAIDNLVKGAGGQAVQNMNIMYGFKETEGFV